MSTVPISRIYQDMAIASQGAVTSVNFFPALVRPDHRDQFSVTVGSDATPAAAAVLACQVVKPTLARDGYPNATYEVTTRDLKILATDATPCP